MEQNPGRLTTLLMLTFVIVRIAIQRMHHIRERSNITWRFRRRGCSNRQSFVIWGRGICPNRHITFIAVEKAELTVPLALFTVYVGGEGWLKTSYGVGDLTLLKKPSYVIWTFPSLNNLYSSII